MPGLLPAAPGLSAPPATAETVKPQHFKRLDVRKLLARGGNPFTVIRASVDALRTDEGLIVVSPFLPSPLIEKLGGEGFASRVEPQSDGSWVTYFWREAADEANS